MTEAVPVYPQSAVIPYRVQDGQLAVLVITASDAERWVLPKGLLEPGLSPAESAAQEALEEAGVRGQVSPASVGTYAYEKWGGVCRVEVFLLRVEEVLDQWQEMKRIREWVSVAEAAARMREKELQRIVLRVPDLVGQVFNLSGL